MIDKNLEIRPVEQNDIPPLAKIYLKLRKEIMNVDGRINMMNAYIDKRLSQDNHFIYVADLKGKIIGTIAFQIKGKNNAIITDAYVLPKFRRKGILKSLENKVMIFLKKKGIKNADLTVRIHNEPGKATWSSLGYKTIMEVKRKLIN